MSGIPTITKQFIPSFELLTVASAVTSLLALAACVGTITALCGLVFILFTMVHFLAVLCDALTTAYVQYSAFGHTALLFVGLLSVFVWACRVRFSVLSERA